MVLYRTFSAGSLLYILGWSPTVNSRQAPYLDRLSRRYSELNRSSIVKGLQTVLCPSTRLAISTSLSRSADRYAYAGCGSTAYCYLFYLGDEQILIDIRKPCRPSASLVRIAGPCPAEVYECTSVRTCEWPRRRGLFATVFTSLML